AVVSVSELACHVPGCPPKETVILVMHGTETVQASVHKPMKDVTENDVAHAFSAANARLSARGGLRLMHSTISLGSAGMPIGARQAVSCEIDVVKCVGTTGDQAHVVAPP